MNYAIEQTLLDLGFKNENGCYRHPESINVALQDGELQVTCMEGNAIATQFRICLDCFGDLDLASEMIAGALKAVIAG